MRLSMGEMSPVARGRFARMSGFFISDPDDSKDSLPSICTFLPIGPSARAFFKSPLQRDVYNERSVF
jgi:hypothetical protein